jgi:hypothetical protein
MALKSRLGHRLWRAASVSALFACASAGSALAQAIGGLSQKLQGAHRFHLDAAEAE